MLTALSQCAQAEASTIVTAAHQVNAGIVPTLDPILSSQLQVAPQFAAQTRSRWQAERHPAFSYQL